MSISLDKCIVLHCGSKQPFNVDTIGNRPIASAKLFKDLGVMRSADGRYAELCKASYAKACRIASAKRRILNLKR